MIWRARHPKYSNDATADCAFLQDILGFASVDAGHGWLIFARPRPKWRYIPLNRPPEIKTGANSTSCATISNQSLKRSRKRESGVRMLKKKDGVRLAGFGFPAGARSVSISPGALPR
jgi:hypothetical protein